MSNKQIYAEIVAKINKEIKSINIHDHLVKTTDVDDHPDLTDVHPRDRNDLNMFFLNITEELFPETFKIIKKDKQIRDGLLIAFAPHSQIYTHVDEPNIEPYGEIDWYSVFIGIEIPSFDKNKVAVKVGDTVFDHSDYIIFDPQIPHSAWNRTDDWWISVRLAIKKEE